MKVTLFPFLSVLLCTMGAMIMLLAVVAMNVRDDAKDNPPLHSQIEEAQWFASHFAEVKQQYEDKVADLQTKLALAEKETQKIIAEIKRVLQLADNMDNVDTAQTAAFNIDAFKQKLQQAESELLEARKNFEDSKKSYAIIPYKGQNGTYRRPVYIECVQNKVIVQPEGVVLTVNDFLTAERPDNPFDLVLRTVYQYYRETNQASRGSEPYPLLVVRPSGVGMYCQVGKALGHWVKDYGYELVNEDWKVEYPAANTELKERLEKQLAISRQRMVGWMLAMREAAGNEAGQRAGYTAEQRTGNAAEQKTEDETDTQTALKPRQIDLLSPAAQDVLLKPKAIAAVEQRAGYEAERNIPSAHEPNSSSALTNNNENKIVSTNDPIRPTMNIISRTVKVRCDANQIVLNRQAGLPMERRFNMNEDAVEGLLEALMDYQETWGSAGNGVNWNVVLQVHVDTGGEHTAETLKQALRHTKYEMQIR